MMAIRIPLIACALVLSACATDPYQSDATALETASRDDTGVEISAVPEQVDIGRVEAVPDEVRSQDASDYFETELKTRVELALRQSGLNDVIVLVDEEEVYLSGSVETVADKDRARSLAADVPGVGLVYSDAVDIA